MPSPSANTHVRREDARATLLAVEYYDTTLTDTERVMLACAASLLERVKVNPNGPMTQEQRGALFASFGEVFGHTDRPARLAFTGMVLGKNPERLSWSNHGGITYGEASKVLDALDLLNV